MTRPDKAPAKDRQALHAAWRASAMEADLDLPAMIVAAEARQQEVPTGWARLAQAVGSIGD